MLVLLMMVGFAAIITKPSDEQCVELAKNGLNSEIHNSSSNLFVKGLESLFVDLTPGALFRIEDDIFYKTIYLKIDNSKIGMVVFNTFILFDSDDHTISGKSRNNNQSNSGNQDFQNKQDDDIPGTVVDKRNAPSANEPKIETDTTIPNSTNEISTNERLEELKAELYAAKDKMAEIKKFHFLRTDDEREEQIKEQEQIILSIENKLNAIRDN